MTAQVTKVIGDEGRRLAPRAPGWEADLIPVEAKPRFWSVSEPACAELDRALVHVRSSTARARHGSFPPGAYEAQLELLTELVAHGWRS